MRRAVVKYNGIKAGILSEEENGEYLFVYHEEYRKNYPELFITFSMPVSKQNFRSKNLFPFFDGLIPEGWLLDIASESWKINKNDRMGLLLSC
ncbi:MAG: phosphatidylinositol kinase [Cytophagales bacterium]|nr:phosphatidylinositol kinase [Cytophagales bacterium]